eukprot:Rhum_TRINITY_DN11254_c1_g1::Rhum_TRINITY_DN11254_c1_g1_i1::g.43565::m.43565
MHAGDPWSPLTDGGVRPQAQQQQQQQQTLPNVATIAALRSSAGASDAQQRPSPPQRRQPSYRSSTPHASLRRPEPPALSLSRVPRQHPWVPSLRGHSLVKLFLCPCLLCGQPPDAEDEAQGP